MPIYFYTKSNQSKHQTIYLTPDDAYIEKYFTKIDEDGKRFQSISLTQQGQGDAKYFGDKLIDPPRGMHWIWSQERINKAFNENRIYFTKNDFPRFKRFLDEGDLKGKPIDDIWVDPEVAPLNSWHKERLGYPTQKPESLLERIIKASSNEGDLILDPFCGCGTTIAVAERLKRRWIGIDITPHAIELTTKRLTNTQRLL